MKEGWICPRCGKVNAPFIESCDCKPYEAVSNTDSECGCGGFHDWQLISVWNRTDGAGYRGRCRKCGETKDVYDAQ